MSDRDVTTRATTRPVTYRAAPRGMPARQQSRPVAYAQPRRSPSVPYVSLPDDPRERRKWWEWVIDRLSTFQYMGANVAEDIGRGAWDDPIGKGWTGERRGDWTNVLWGGPSSAEGGADQPGLLGSIDPSKEASGFGARAARGVTGFAANVLLDPTTYLTFGATSAGRAGAQQFAKLAVNQARRQLADPAVVQKIAGRMPTGRLWQKRVQQGGDAATHQHLSRTYRDAYREAISTPGDELRQRFAGRLAREKEDTIDFREALKGDKTPAGKAALKEAQARIVAIDNELAIVRDPQKWTRGAADFPELRGTDYEKGMGQLGERAWRPFGMELRKRQGMTPARRAVAGVVTAVREAARTNPVTRPFLDAWATSQTTGAIGAIRQHLGFLRSGYQTMLRQVELADATTATDAARQQVDLVKNLFVNETEETKTNLLKLVSAVYDRAGQIVGDNVDSPDEYWQLMRQASADALNDPTVRALVPPEQWDATIDLWARMKNLTDEWFGVEQGLAAEGIIRRSGYIENYLPIAFRSVPDPTRRGGPVYARGSSVFRPLRERTASQNIHQAREAERVGAMLGIDRAAAADIVAQNKSRVMTDPEALLVGRAVAHGRMLGRASMMRQMRSMGLNVAELGRPMSGVTRGAPAAGRTFRSYQAPADLAADPEAYRQALIKAFETGDLAEIGLYNIPNEGFLQGYVFDGQVAQMIQRAVDITKGPNQQWYAKMMRDYSSWIKSVMTLRPGFHTRNIFSNWIMISLREGGRAFRPRYLWAGLAGALKQVGGGKVSKAVSQNPQMRKSLQMRIGEHTVEELAEYAREKGVISRISMITDEDNAFGDMFMKQRGRAIVNPLRWQRKAFDVSRDFGTTVESSQRFSMFLMEADKMAQRGMRLTEGELEFAAFEARKWMVDYQDLTEFEQRVLRYVRPFYTWWRKSVPMMIEGIIDAPGLYATAIKGFDALSDVIAGEEDPNRANVPDWLRGLDAQFIGRRGDEGEAVFLDFGAPFSSFDDWFGGITFPKAGEGVAPQIDGVEMLRSVATAAHPSLASLIEVTTDKDLFYDRDLSGFAAAPGLLRNLKAGGPELLQTLDGILRLAGSRRGFGLTDERGNPRLDQEGRLMMDAKWAKVLERHIPTLRWLGQAIRGPVLAAEKAGLAVEETLNEVGIGPDDYEGLDEFLKVLSFYAGVGGHQIDPRQEQYWRIREWRDRRRQERNRFGGQQRIRAPEPAPMLGR